MGTNDEFVARRDFSLVFVKMPNPGRIAMNRCLIGHVLLIALLLGPSGMPGRAEESPPSTRRALLIGCTKYDQNPHFALRGPANDLMLMRKVLVDRLGFPEKNILELSEKAGATGPEKRPTRANIERAFQRLARETQPGDQVLVFLAGHGSQQPERAGCDPAEAKPDGMSEIFLPADIGWWNAGSADVANAIADYEFRAWVKAILGKGAFVFGIVDACHSGTMLRGDSEEVVRGIAPEDLGIPQSVIDDARQRATAQGRSRGEPSSEGVFSNRDMPAHFVALYACQSREPTLERPLPPDQANRIPHGLLTFAVCQTLENATRCPSYRELFEAVQSRYARWGHGDSPSPLLEGRELDQHVLGTAMAPPRRRFLIKRGEDGWTIPAGLLAGIGPDSILAVGGDKPFGYVRVADSRLLSSVVQPYDFGGLPAPSDEQLAGALCEPVRIVLGMSRLKVGFDRLSERMRVEPTPQLDQLERELKEITGSRPGIEVVDDIRLAEWLVQMRDGKPRLLPADAARVLGKLPPDTPQFGIAAERPAEKLADCLERIARVRNLQDLIGFPGGQFFHSGAAREGENAQSPSDDVVVELTMYKLRHRYDKSGEPIRADRGRPVLRPGEWVAWKMTNHSDFPVNVALFFIDAEYHVRTVFPPPGITDNQIDGKKVRWFGPAQVNAKTTGIERVLLLAVRSHGAPVDLGVLAEPRWDAQRGDGMESPLQRLLKDSVFPDGGVRGMNTDVESYAGRTVAWRVMAVAGREASTPLATAGLRMPQDAARNRDGSQLRRALWPPAEKPATFSVGEATLRGTTAELYVKVAPATVVVRAPNNFGTGILIDEAGWVLTNHHVIAKADPDPVTGAKCPSIYLGRVEEGTMQLLPDPVTALVYKDDEARDLALMKLTAHPAGIGKLPVVPLAKTAARPGDACVVVGHPRAAMLWTIREGRVTGAGKWPGDQTLEVIRRMPIVGAREADRRRLADEYAKLSQVSILVSNCGVNFGDSGGPLVNAQGELIGVTFGMPSPEASGGAATSFAYHVRLDEVRSFLADRPKEPLLYLPDPWATDDFVSLVDLDHDGIAETLAFGPGPGETLTALLMDLSDPKLAKPVTMSAGDIANKRAWHFQFALQSAPTECAFYDTNNAGRINLILLRNINGTSNKADHILRLVDGKWKHEAGRGETLVDPSRFTSQAIRERLQKIFESIQKSK
jgi:S1-C subfamily serine protease